MLTYLDIEEAWVPFQDSFMAKIEQGRIGTWLLEHVGKMGIAREPEPIWEFEGYKWAWSLSTCKLEMPVGVYFYDREDAVAFRLAYTFTTLPYRL